MLRPSLLLSLLVFTHYTYASSLQDADKLLASGNCKEAVKIYKAGSEKGIPYANFKLGLLHSSHSCVNLDFLAAEKYYQAAAQKGFKYAYANLGSLYFGNDAPLPDNEKAYKAWAKAKELGIDTRYNLSILLYLGDGVEPAPLLAEEYLIDLIKNNSSDALLAKNLLMDFYSEEDGPLYSEEKLERLKASQ
ncbi:tetratricopeptide repeat protein [Neptuniibacter sp. QD48_11]|uniref:tetratricopeptide repeat protein n=1 Tax=Neptuniibacter sp. QD48_11 TaxID=3398211 RepID=UPI0039F48619